ncbi:MAG: hypothetical protein HQL96_03895 [Magnetococcales bacterium]|nr:hypothetical protein [Magnetococcales bacterium]
MNHIELAALSHIRSLETGSLTILIKECNNINATNPIQHKHNNTSIMLPYLLTGHALLTSRYMKKFITTNKETGIHSIAHLVRETAIKNGHQRLQFKKMDDRYLSRLVNIGNDLALSITHTLGSSAFTSPTRCAFLFHEVWAVVGGLRYGEAGVLAKRLNWINENQRYFEIDTGSYPLTKKIPERKPFYACRFQTIQNLAETYLGNTLTDHKETPQPLKEQVARLRGFLENCRDIHSPLPPNRHGAYTSEVEPQFAPFPFVAFHALQHWAQALLADTEQHNLKHQQTTSYILIEAIIDQNVGISRYGIDFLTDKSAYGCESGTRITLAINAMRFAADMAIKLNRSPTDVFFELWGGLQPFMDEEVIKNDPDNIICRFYLDIDNPPFNFLPNNNNNIFILFFKWLKYNHTQNKLKFYNQRNPPRSFGRLLARWLKNHLPNSLYQPIGWLFSRTTTY